MLELDRVVFFGRTWDESLAMYGLSEADLVGREVRSFPTYAFSGDVRRQPWVEPLMETLRGDGHAVDYLPSNWTQQGHLDFNDCLQVIAKA